MKSIIFTFLSLLIISLSINSNANASDLLELWKKVKFNNTEPTDPEYWNYYNRYLKHSVLDLIISGKDSKQLYKNLKALLELKEQNVIIGKIVVVGGNNFAFLNSEDKNKLINSKEFYLNLKRSLGKKAKDISYKDLIILENRLGISPELSEIASKIGFDQSKQIPDINYLLKEFNISLSPTWIVTYHNKQIIYEGEYNIKKLFTRDGVFNPSEALETKVTHHKSKLGIPFISKEDKERDNQVMLALDYDMEPWKTFPGAGTYDVLPECSESRIRKTEVLINSDNLKEFDITYYKLGNTPIKKNLQGISTAYIPGDLSNPKRNENNMAQNLARLLDIKCLPTRAHYVIINGKMYEEYREKERAWDAEKN